MTVKAQYKIISENGAMLFLPPYPLEGFANIGKPDVMATSTGPLYPIGTLLWFPGMGKKYRYSRAGASDLVGTKHLGANGNYTTGATVTNTHGFYGHCQEDGVASAYDIGETVIYITDTINKAKNFYAGGHLIHFDAARNVCFEESYIVSGPDAAITTPWRNTKITLAEPKKYAIVASDGIEIWLNPYSNIIAEVSDEHVTYMGGIPLPVTAYHYFWLQTAGPAFITPDGWGVNLPGYAVDKRIAVSNSGILSSATTLAWGHQIIGTIICRTSNTHGAAWVNLSLDLGD